MAVDPGTITVGVAIFNVHPSTLSVELDTAFTVDASPAMSGADDFVNLHGGKLVRLDWIYYQIGNVLREYHPNRVVSEAPFAHRNPSTFASLVEAVSYIQNAVWDYDRLIPFTQVPPVLPKKHLGVKANSESKINVQKKLLSMEASGSLKSKVPLNSLDEHSFDAVAIGLWQIGQLL